MIEATCHCGAIRIAVPRRPRTLTNCNCSICRRYGALWAYYRASDVRIDSASAGRHGYVWGDREIRFVRCADCGCVTHWEPIVPRLADRMAVNARLFDPDALGPVRIRRFDGATSWRYLD